MHISLIYFLLNFFMFSNVLAPKLEKMPDIDLKNFKGETVNIQKYTSGNHIKLISLWATWCGPCRLELNALKEVQEDWAEKYGVEIIAITLDNPRSLKRAMEMTVAKDWDYTFFHDFSGQLSNKLRIRGIPYSLLVDQTGKIVSNTQGYYQGYEKEIEKKLIALSKKS